MNKLDKKKYDKAYGKKNKKRLKDQHKVYYQKNRVRVDALNRKSYDRRKELLNKIKDEPCLDCKRKFPPCAMDFDHVRGDKEFTIGPSWATALDKLLEEIEKCELVCANCHRIRTQKRRGF